MLIAQEAALRQQLQAVKLEYLERLSACNPQAAEAIAPHAGAGPGLGVVIVPGGGGASGGVLVVPGGGGAAGAGSAAGGSAGPGAGAGPGNGPGAEAGAGSGAGAEAGPDSGMGMMPPPMPDLSAGPGGEGAGDGGAGAGAGDGPGNGAGAGDGADGPEEDPQPDPPSQAERELNKSMAGCWKSELFRHALTDDPGVSLYCFDEQGEGSLVFTRGQRRCETTARIEYKEDGFLIADEGGVCSDGTPWYTDEVDCRMVSPDVVQCDGVSLLDNGERNAWTYRLHRTK